MGIDHSTLHGVAFPEVLLNPLGNPLISTHDPDGTSTVRRPVDLGNDSLAVVAENDTDGVAVLAEKTARFDTRIREALIVIGRQSPLSPKLCRPGEPNEWQISGGEESTLNGDNGVES